MSRDCDEALANLYLYLDSELDQVSIHKVKTHLEECRGCDAPFDFEKRLRQVVRERLNEDLPEAFVMRLRAVLALEITGP
ncbi:MAG: zf-HC2 domain-containing protein [Actinobacteria bacterium]|nr:zf-HC2 domain-containing protein [Actinomycetota bacterium]MCI0542839.1 zf-HC2 domain-containing protein [Actinomycetota bacterium]